MVLGRAAGRSELRLAETRVLWESPFVGEMWGLVSMYQVGTTDWVAKCRQQIGNEFSGWGDLVGLGGP